MVLNLVWAMLAVGLLATVYRGIARGRMKISMAKAMTIAVVICFISLPVLSASDDMLAASQAGLPLSGQTWRLISEDVAACLELPPIDLYLILLLCCVMAIQPLFQERRSLRLQADRVAISERLRPPPLAAL